MKSTDKEIGEAKESEEEGAGGQSRERDGTGTREVEEVVEVVVESRLSKSRALLVTLGVSAVYLSWGVMYSVLSPLYPREAEAKGARPTQYGFVFGIAHLAAFLFSPVAADFGERIAPKRIFAASCLVETLTGGIAFSFLPHATSTGAFLGLSYFLRFVYGTSDAASSSAALGMMSKLFPDKSNTIMSVTESTFGLGYTIGPALGSFLFTVGGFQLPFLVAGVLSFAASSFLFCSIPSTVFRNTKARARDSDRRKGENNRLSTFKLMKIPLAVIALSDTVLGMCGDGFLESMLEPHARSAAGMSVTDIGVAFLLGGLFYMLTSPLAGLLCDRLSTSASLAAVSSVGNVVLLFSKLGAGPAPFLSPPLAATQTLIYAACFLDGVGIAFVLVSTFARVSAAVEGAGYQSDTNTCMVVSGVWYSSFFFGSFLGPTMAGPLVDWLGFPKTGALFSLAHLLVALVDLTIAVYYRVSSLVTDHDGERRARVEESVALNSVQVA